MNKYLPEKIKKLNEYIPIEEEYRVILNANESPFAPSKKVLAEFADAVKDIKYNRYPDPYTKDMIVKFSRIYNVDANNVVAGSGSDELISIIINSYLTKGDKVMCVFPDFSMYAFYSEITEAEIIKYHKPENYKIDFVELAQIINENKVKLVILSNPCNPTGVAYEHEIILNFIKKINCIAVIDEAYMDFCTRDYSILNDYDKYENLIILKTLSKMGYAGLRIGFAVGDRELINGIKKVKSPYNVNTVSQVFAAVALKNFDEMKNNIEIIVKNREALYNKLCEYANGYSVIKPDANFVSIIFDDEIKANNIFETLAGKGIIIRYFKPCMFRITCGTAEEIAEFLEEFKNLL